MVLSVVLTGPTSSSRRSDDEEDDNGNNDDKDINNNNSSEKWRNSFTNVYIECKRISKSPQLLERGQKQQLNAIDNKIVYNEEDASFSC